MRLSELTITNYKALRDVTIPLSRFGCLIGENNSGKSSFLQALTLFFSGTKLDASYFFDESKPIRISVTFKDIDDADLVRLAEKHRTKVVEIVNNGCLTLIRYFSGPNSKSTLLYNTLMPIEERFSKNSIDMLVKGQRRGQTFVDRVVETFPELDGIIDISMHQGDVRDRIKDLADSLSEEQKEPVDTDLPTGIDTSIIPMLPEPLYVPAVKDLADEIKTKQTTSFGKILNILLKIIEPKLPDAQELFEELNSKLNRVQQPDGTFVDERLEEVRLIESTVEKYVNESFADVSLHINIPPPELQAILTSTCIYVDDGVEGLIDSKGDGLRRAVLFSILRSYVKLNTELTPTPTEEPAEAAQPQDGSAPASYLLLFEEPELYLYPKAQSILFNALGFFAEKHHVLVTTHSPMFFGPEATETFVKLQRVTDPEIADKPFTQVQPVDLTDITTKDQFQIICYDNNNAAFFAKTVVLVEGDSDYLVLPHIAKTLNPSWDVAQSPVIYARIMGKGNIRRYRNFFHRFDVRVPVIADLDLIITGFDHIDPNQSLSEIRSELIQKVDELLSTSDNDEEPSATAASARTAHNSGELKGLWQSVLECEDKLEAGTCTQDDLDEAVNSFYAYTKKKDRLDVLKNPDNDELLSLKLRLLDELRKDDVYVLEKGAVEDYYPQGINGVDKPSRAFEFCKSFTNSDDILECCNEQVYERDGEELREKEFILIFKGIFEN